MILGFGNNVVSALAAEITASQKTIPVMPGTGAKFAELLTQDNDNPSTELDVFAKITLTDSGETEFEICHLLSVSGDVLSVLRGQEGTAAKGWMLNDVVANFATRGSENQFVQVDHLQSGFYCAGVAGGSANALTLSLPSSFFLNSSTDWMLRTPVIVYPTQNNTGAATLQLILGGSVLGTFPLYKGDKDKLVAGDVLKDVALVCLLDKTKTFFSVMNPGAIYAGLGTAAFHDVTTSHTDGTANRVLRVADFGLGGYGTDTQLATPDDAKKPLRNGFYGVSNEPTYGNSAIISFGFDSDSQTHIIATQGGQAPLLGVCGSTPQGVFGNWGKIYTEFQKPTAIEVGAVPYRGVLGTVDLNTIRGTQYGRFNQPMTANATTARNYPIAEAGALDVHQTSAGGPESCVQEYRSFSSRRIFLRSYNQSDNVWTDWCEYYTTAKKPTAADVGAIPLSGSTAVTGIVRNSAEFQSTSANNFRMAYGGYGAFWRQDGNDLYLMLTNDGDQYGSYNNLRPFTVNLASGHITMGRLSLSDYTNFDARYNAKFPTGHRIGARTKISGLGGVTDWSSRIPQGAINIASLTEGDDRITDAYYASPQYLINGNWVNFA